MAEIFDWETLAMKTMKRLVKAPPGSAYAGGWDPAAATKMDPNLLKRFDQTSAKNRFVELCERVRDTQLKVYVKDKAGAAYLTLAPNVETGALKPIEVTAQRFKSNFARFSHLIKDGVVFKILLNDGNDHVIARQHTDYRDPLQDVLDEWIRQLRAVPAKDDQERDD